MAERFIDKVLLAIAGEMVKNRKKELTYDEIEKVLRAKEKEEWQI